MNIATKVKFLLEVQVQFKINHWQTKAFARHNAFGGIYDALGDLIDRFVEESMGKYGRFTLDAETDTIKMFNINDILDETKISSRDTDNYEYIKLDPDLNCLRKEPEFVLLTQGK